ncbi:hypothetical protein GQX74_003114 [Glossina fuscipes]|nr:hypothetical protein GQX74_003114 [Glossina fuscipes]
MIFRVESYLPSYLNWSGAFLSLLEFLGGLLIKLFISRLTLLFDVDTDRQIYVRLMLIKLIFDMRIHRTCTFIFELLAEFPFRKMRNQDMQNMQCIPNINTLQRNGRIVENNAYEKMNELKIGGETIFK